MFSKNIVRQLFLGKFHGIRLFFVHRKLHDELTDFRDVLRNG
ncbi:hypothetical protein [Kocuria sp. TGY1127_2]|nr:hypothetical protein [Kocuria sp. TGY1127_2]